MYLFNKNLVFMSDFEFCCKINNIEWNGETINYILTMEKNISLLVRTVLIILLAKLFYL